MPELGSTLQSLPPTAPSQFLPFGRCVEKGVEYIDVSFKEEPLGLGSKHGFGHYDAQFGEVMGPANGSTEYRIERKLGWGLYSSVWLARELQKDRFVALKILTTHATNLHLKAVFIEIDALALLMGHLNIIDPLRCFTIPSKQGHGDLEEEKHVVIATALYSGSLKDIIKRSPDPFPPLPFVKRALLHVLRGLAHMHSHNLVHTAAEFALEDLKSDNILVDNGPLTNADIDALLAVDPPRRYPPEASESQTVEVAVSQPLPVPTIEEAMTRTFCISDMGVVRPKDSLKAGMHLSPSELQAPEVILGAPLDEKVDIWLFGLLLHETLTGYKLFTRPTREFAADSPTDSEELEPDSPTEELEPDIWKHEPDDPIWEHEPDALTTAISFQLWQMCALLTNVDVFPPYLRGGIHADKYLDSDGGILEPYLPKQQHGTLRRTLDGQRPGLDAAEGAAIAAILERCLKLDARERPRAAELLEDPWWWNVQP
ncbi:kinase-like domain-containing protein [Ganoderma leucocontextum]|nr:kinase-like domain-containing protein [Ganoderma leucocontextum]